MVTKTTTAEFALARSGDSAATEALLARHEPMVVRIVGKYADPISASFEDLKQIGLLALWRAITSFEPERGNAFSTWAWPWIENAVTSETRIDNLLRVRPGVEGQTEETLQLKKAARRPTSLSQPVAGDDARTVGDMIAGKTEAPEAGLLAEEESRLSTQRYRSRLSRLNPRYASVVNLRIKGLEFREIGDELGMSTQRAQQIWGKSIEQLQRGTSRWTQREDNYLRRHAGTISARMMIVNRTPGAIYQRLRFLGLSARRPWTDAEYASLRDYSQGSVALSVHLGNRSPVAIRSQAARLGIHKYKHLTPEQITAMVALHKAGYSSTEVGTSLGCSGETVRLRLLKLGYGSNAYNERWRDNQKRKSNVRQASADREEKYRRRALSLGWNEPRLGAAATLEALSRIGTGDRHDVTAEVAVLCRERSWLPAYTGWVVALKWLKILGDEGTVRASGVGNQRREYSLCETTTKAEFA